MLDFLKSDTGLILLIGILAVAVAVVLIHSIRTRRAVKRMLDYQFAEMSVAAMLAEADRNRDAYSALPPAALENAADAELLERVNYHMLAKGGGDPVGWMLDRPAEERAVYLALWIRQQMRMGNFPQLFLGDRSKELIQAAAAAYRAIGAPSCAKVLEKTKESVDARIEKKGTQMAIRRSVLESAAEGFRWYDKRENVREKLAAFLRDNRAAVCDAPEDQITK